MRLYHFGGTTKLLISKSGTRMIRDGHCKWRAPTHIEDSLIDYAMIVEAWVPTLLKNLTLENTGLLRMFRRWQISDEPLRADAAAALEQIKIESEGDEPFVGL